MKEYAGFLSIQSIQSIQFKELPVYHRYFNCSKFPKKAHE